MINPFFKNHGPYPVKKLLQLADIKAQKNFSDIEIVDVKDLDKAEKENITFFHLKKYDFLASKTKAAFCITTNNLSQALPKSCEAIIVDNVLIATAIITKIFYPDAVTDDFDDNVNDINETTFKDNVKFGKNILVCQNVQIGKN